MKSGGFKTRHRTATAQLPKITHQHVAQAVPLAQPPVAVSQQRVVVRRGSVLLQRVPLRFCSCVRNLSNCATVLSVSAQQRVVVRRGSILLQRVPLRLKAYRQKPRKVGERSSLLADGC